MTLTTDQRLEKQSPDALIRELERTGLSGIRPRKHFVCPFHGDTDPSAHIYEANSGAGWRFHCFGCDRDGDVFDVRDWINNRKPGQSLAGRKQAPTRPPMRFASLDAYLAWIGHKKGQVEDIYRYGDRDAKRLDFYKVRYVPHDGSKDKSFSIGSPNGDGVVLGAPPQPWPLYGLASVRKAERVVMVEGEKCVHCGRAMMPIEDLTFTTCASSSGGSDTDLTPLAGKRVWLWPDPDEKGQGHMRAIAQKLRTLDPVPSVCWIDPAAIGLTGKQDIVQFVQLYGFNEPSKNIPLLEHILSEAEPITTSSGIRRIVEDTISGKRRSIKWPWSLVSLLTKALMPGTVTMLAGMPSGGKSLFLLQALAFWYAHEIPIAAFMLEDNRDYHVMRALAQRCKCASLTDDDWIRYNPSLARAALDANREFIDGFGSVIHDRHQQRVTLKSVGKWVEKQAAEGKRIIAVDPIMAAQTSAQRFQDDSDFINTVKAVAESHNTSIILVNHLNRTTGQMRGGQNYDELAHTILRLKAQDPEDMSIVNCSSVSVAKVNRIVEIGKARNGKGTGVSLGYWFDPETLLFEERGSLEKKRRKK